MRGSQRPTRAAMEMRPFPADKEPDLGSGVRKHEVGGAVMEVLREAGWLGTSAAFSATRGSPPLRF
jgi:hypothetical protein